MLITDVYNNEAVLRNYDDMHIFQYLRLLYATNDSKVPVDDRLVTPGKQVQYNHITIDQYDIRDSLFEWLYSRLAR